MGLQGTSSPRTLCPRQKGPWGLVKGIRGQGRMSEPHMNVAICPCRPGPPGSVAKTVARPEAITSSSHAGSDSESHSLHRPALTASWCLPQWSLSLASGTHRRKDTGPSSRGPGPGRGCGPSS